MTVASGASGWEAPPPQKAEPRMQGFDTALYVPRGGLVTGVLFFEKKQPFQMTTLSFLQR